MFLTANELNTNDFLKAIQFIPPAGMSVDYFVAPQKLNGETAGFAPDAEPTYPESDSIIYTRKDPNTKIQQQDTPADYSAIPMKNIVNTGGKMPVVPQVTPIEGKKCPFIDVLSEDSLGTDVILKESFGPFAKNTLFHCVKIEG